ncbi:MAG: Fe-S oxidoreductase, partial [Gammaproteobacteria bacterium]
PHLMLRGKAVKFREGQVKARDRLITNTDAVGRLAGIPVVVKAVNASEKAGPVRKLMDKVLGIHPEAWLPPYHADTLHRRFKKRPRKPLEPRAGERTRGKVVLFGTCYGEYNEPDIAMDLVRAFEHNGIPVELAESRCCGMPKLEIGDLETVERLKAFNIPRLAKWVEEGYDLVAPVPSCALMFKQELPLLFPGEEAVEKVARAMYDPFEYLLLREEEGLLNTDFKVPLGKVVHHAACHMRVQNIGLKSRELLSRVPDTAIVGVERCSGHDGTYAMKSEFHEVAMKIGRPVFNRVRQAKPDYYTSDCPIAGHQIETGLGDGSHPTHPLTLLCIAYGLKEKP